MLINSFISDQHEHKQKGLSRVIKQLFTFLSEDVYIFQFNYLCSENLLYGLL